MEQTCSSRFLFSNSGNFWNRVSGSWLLNPSTSPSMLVSTQKPTHHSCWLRRHCSVNLYLPVVNLHHAVYHNAAMSYCSARMLKTAQAVQWFCCSINSESNYSVASSHRRFCLVNERCTSHTTNGCKPPTHAHNTRQCRSRHAEGRPARHFLPG